MKLQDGGSSRPEPQKVSNGATADAPDEDEKEEAIQDLKPLLDYLSSGKVRPPSADGLKSYLSTALRDTEVRCLVITLPDPIESVASGRFDEYLDVVQRAVELQGYVMDRSLLPWRRGSDGSNPPSDRVTRLRRGGRDLDVSIETTTPPKPRESRPGLMLFRRAFPGTAPSPKEPSLLLAFLVPESPITGIHKRALFEALTGSISTFDRSRFRTRIMSLHFI